MPLLVVGVLGIGVPLLTCGRSNPVEAQQTPTGGAAGAKPGAAAPAHPLDQPLQWMYEARKAYSAVRDYECTLVKQERIDGVLSPQNIILMKFRGSPFSVNMRWLAPTPGQEVSFVYGRNNNMMRVNFSKGLKKAIGFVSVDPFDGRVMKHSRHHIYEAGIGNLIEQTIKNMEMERRLNKTQVQTAEYTYNERPCWRIESTRTERMAGADGRDVFYSHRTVMYLDKERKLPIRAENYDWPVQGGTPGGDLMEMFSFVNLNLNVGLTDAHFAR
jgi:hypothetical protein